MIRYVICLLFAVVFSFSGKVVAKVPSSVEIIVGYESGGSYDLYCRFVAQNLAKHLSGTNIIVKNMPGAGGLTATNYLYSYAKKDGSVLGVVSQNIVLSQMISAQNINYDSSQFGYIGRMMSAYGLVGVRDDSPMQSIQDATKVKSYIAIGEGISPSVLYVKLLNQYAKTQFIPISGYSGRETRLAMERKEIDGSSRITINDVISGEASIRYLVQAGRTRHALLPDVPLFQEIIPGREEFLNAILSTDEFGRFIIAPPGIKSEILTEYRIAFDNMMREERNSKIPLDYASGEYLESLAKSMINLDKNILLEIIRFVNQP